MEQNLSINREVDHVLLAKSSHDLKRVICGVIWTLEIISMEANRDRLQSTAAVEIVDYIAYLQLAAGNMLSNLDRLLSALDEHNPEVRQVKGLAHYSDLNGVDYGGCMSPVLREKWVRDISKLPPRIWCV